MERVPLNLAGLSVCTFDLAAYRQKKVDSMNALVGNLTDYNCPLCKNRGYIAFLQDSDVPGVRDCKCLPVRKSLARIKSSGLAKAMEAMTFDTFVPKEHWQQRMKYTAMEYAKNPTGWLVFSGQSGSGKTHLCTAVCGQKLREGVPLLYISWRESISRLKSLSLDDAQRTTMLEELKNAPLLYIDDLFKTGKDPLGSTQPSQADCNLAFELLNYRSNNRLPTVISTEKTPDELLLIDEAIGGRIIENAGKFICCVDKDSHKNYRLRNIQRL